MVNLVHGGRERVEAILDHPGIDAISFVGQATTARLHRRPRAAATGKRVQALGGAKNSLVVMPDADLEQAVPAIMGSAFGAAGQRCLAGSVAVLVGDEARQDEVRDALARRPREPAHRPRRRRRTPTSARWSRPRPASGSRRRSRRPQRTGAEVVLDGRGDAGPAGHACSARRSSTTADHESELAREEIFGPVLAVVAAADLDEALEFVNGSRYGNAGSIFTTSGRGGPRATATASRPACSASTSACPRPSPGSRSPAGRTPCDGDLHANGTDAVEFYTRKKVVTSRWR